MNRWRPRYRLPPKPPPPPNPEELAARELAELDADVARLKARGAQLKEELACLNRKLGVEHPDWLLYLPKDAASPAHMIMAHRYLERHRASIEARGGNIWLDADHDYKTRVFIITKFKLIEGAIFCSGEFTNPKYRNMIKGVSPDNSTFAADTDIYRAVQRKTPPDAKHMWDLPAESREAAVSPQVFGNIGAVSLQGEPAQGRSGIFRLKRIEQPPHKPSAYAQSLAERKRE